MDPASWSAYSQHLSRLGAAMTVASGSLPQSAQLNDLALSSTLPRQDHLSGYGNTGGPHPFLLATSHGLNPSQAASRGDPSFNAFVTNYDASLLSASFQPSNKGHISTFPQSVGLFKTVSRDNDYPDLRTGFAHCGMASYGRNPDSNAGLSGNAGLGSNALFPNSMPSGSWRPAGMMPSSCGPFGILPHETVLQRSHLVRRSSEKNQGSKSSHSSLSGTPFMEQDLSRGYRGILSSPARPSSSFMDPNNPNHSSLLSPQNDPYFSSVTDSYYSSCSKPDFSSYSSYCSNMQNAVQRSAISPYCYPQSYGSLEASIDKQEHPSTLNASVSANASFSNFVPNSNLSRSHQPNGLVPRQTVITSSSGYSSQHHNAHSTHSYSSSRDAYNCVSSVPNSNLPAHSGNNGNSGSSGRSVQQGQSNSSHHLSIGQPHYPPMSTPIPAATPAHPTPPSTMGQAHVPAVLPMSHDSGYSSMNSQPIVYNSASDDGCYSTPGTCDSESTSPAKQDLSQHSSPLEYSVENSSNLSMNSSAFIESNRMPPQEMNHVNPLVSSAMTNDDNASKSSKILENNLSAHNSSMMSPGCHIISKDVDISSMNANNGHSIPVHPPSMYESRVLNMSHPDVQIHDRELLNQCDNMIPARPECLSNSKAEVFSYAGESSSSVPAVDYTQKLKHKGKRGRKRKSESHESPYHPNYNYPHIPNLNHALPSQPSHIGIDVDKEKSLNSINYETIPNQSKYPISDASALPVDLSHVPLSLSTKKQNSPTDTPLEIEEKCPKVTDINYNHNIIHSEWQCSNDVSEKELEQPCHKSNSSPCEEDSKNNQELGRASSIEDLSNESKSKLCNNIEDDLGFLAELSAASDVDDAASKESFSEKKMKKQQGFLQSFLTFLESSNEPTAPSDTGNLETEKPTLPTKCDIPELPVLTDKDVESENNWLVNKEEEEKSTEGSSKKNEEKHNQLDGSSAEKDSFDEAPSLDPGLFSCSTLQKEMVVPNPEAPSFSSDEDENSAQGIFDSVAMAIQRLCDDNDEENKPKSPNFEDAKSKEDIKLDDKVSDCLQQNGDVDMLLKEKENHMQPDKNAKVEAETVPPLIVKQRRGRRKRGRHLLVIKVNRVKKQSTVVAPSLKVSNKPKRKSYRTNKFRAVEAPTENFGRRPLMRKCKQKRFQRNCETKRKRKTRNSSKQKYSMDEQDEKEIIVLDDDDEEDKKNEMEVGKANEEVKVVKADVEVPAETSTAIAIPEVTPKKIKRISRRRRKRKKPHLQNIKSNLPSKEATVQNETTDVAQKTSATNKLPEQPSNVPKESDSTNSEPLNKNNEPHFKTGDYITCIDGSDNGSSRPPIWRIEGKNVLQIFEAFKDSTSGVLYKNTSSYSRWSPSSKHKYTKLLVNVIQCDDDTVIIEMPKANEKPENVDISGSLSSDNYAAHPQRENFEVYLQTLVSHALDPDFIPEIVKENDEYFLSHIKEIEKITSQKKSVVLSGKKWDSQFLNSAETFPYLSISKIKDEESQSCQLCNCSNCQFCVHFHGQLYDVTTLESKVESKGHPVCDQRYPLCGSCVQTVSLYSRLHHHKYHFYQLGCKKVKDVKTDSEKNSHTVLEECLQDTKWMSQMFQDIIELWNSCDKFR